MFTNDNKSCITYYILGLEEFTVVWIETFSRTVLNGQFFDDDWKDPILEK